MDDSGKEDDSIVEHCKSTPENPATEKEVDGAAESEKLPESAPCPFFLLGRCRFGERCRNPHVGQPEASCTLSTKTAEKGESASAPKGKKPPMKTATDVISRIQWDAMLPKEHFSIGYLDRFTGIVEKPFSEFSWEDLASVSHDVLAIPKHRIQYFKYKRLVVWDKTTRVDNVFGSTGSGMTILDVIDHYEDLMQMEEDLTSEEESDGLVREVENVNDDHLGGNHNFRKLRPTHFIAVRVGSEDVRCSANKVQEELLKWNPDIAEFCIPLAALHLTLGLLHLDSPEDIQRALSVVEDLRSDIRQLLPPNLILQFEGLKDFHSRILYMAPTSIPELTNFVQVLNGRFSSKGLTVIEPPGNNLHVTIAKVPRNILKKKPSLSLSYDAYGHTNVTSFGAQPVDAISFCLNNSSRRSDGFYTTPLEISLCGDSEQ
ncbi:leukocyte receptor cluster member 9 [Spea bombifrons]|uniref:leukocyte receptor cluster member 9 n=1 Tax=Spea bombifrons TaxID=233779 RepID=UPI00234BF591|nr:leukocyte receptor cluster member 9 [Spea bombifrons]